MNSFLIFTLLLSYSSCQFLNIANLTGGGFVANWVGLDHSTLEVQVHNTIYDSNQNPIKSDTIIANTGSYKGYTTTRVTGTQDGGYAVLWIQNTSKTFQEFNFETQFQIFDGQGNPKTKPQIVNTITTDNDDYPDMVTLSNGNLLVLFTQGSTQNQTDLLFNIYDPAGKIVGSSKVLSHKGLWWPFPSVSALRSGDFIASWKQQTQSDGSDIFYQRFDSQGKAKTQPQIVASPLISEPDAVSVGLLDGSYIYVWDDFSAQNDTSRGVFYQRYSAFDTKIGGIVQVNTQPSHQDPIPQVASLKDGGYLVGWKERLSDNSFTSNAQRYSVAGTKVGGQQVLASSMTEDCLTGVQGLPNDDFIVLWEQFDQDAVEVYVFGQRFNGLNQKVGGVFNVSESDWKDNRIFW